MGEVLDGQQGRHEGAVAMIDLPRTAASERSGVAGGLWFNPGAFQHDVMMTPYEPAMAAWSEPNGTSCVKGVT